MLHEEPVRDRVMLREDPLGPSPSGMASRLERLGFRAEFVPDDAVLRRTLAQPAGPAALLVNVALGRSALRTALSVAAGPSRLTEITVLAVGDRPDPSLRQQLRIEGVTLAAFGHVDDPTLRFQINRAFVGVRSPGPPRQERRTPVNWQAGLESHRTRLRCRVTNLSRRGAFVEMDRPPAPGEAVRIDLPLPSGPTRLDAEVRYVNSTGARRRTRAPAGMGVTFADADSGVRARIDQVLAEYGAELLV